MTRLMIVSLLSAMVATPVMTQDRLAPDAFSALRTCRAVTADTARLACFDQAARALDEGEAKGDLIVVDRTEIQDTRQRLFGLDVPNVRLLDRFGGQGQVEAIESTLTRAHQASRGEWVFELADGSIWRQVDTERLSGRAQAGATVRVRRAALGSYFINIGDARALRARRDR